MITRYSSPADVAASGLVMRKTRQPLAARNVNKEKDLNRLPVHCYTLNWLLEGGLSQNKAKILENMSVTQVPFPR
jgi:hypothetical protein